MLGWFACHPTDPVPVPLPTDTPSSESGDGHTGLPDPDAAFLSCVGEGANTQRGWCHVELAEPAAVELRFSADGERDRVFTSAQVATAHDVFFWALVADTRWTVTSESTLGERRDVTFRTRPLPKEFTRFAVTAVLGGQTQVSGLLFAPSCPSPYVVVTDELGRVVYWLDTQPEDGFLGGVDAYSITDRGTIVVILGKRRIREFAFDGTLLRDLVRDQDFDEFVHHDLVGRDGRLWVLSARRVTHERTDYVVDGVLVFDLDTGAQVAKLEFEGWFPFVEEPWMGPGFWFVEFPDTVDLTHANALAFDADGNLWVSFRHLFAFAVFEGDPTAPGFGALVALVPGDPASPVLDDRVTARVADDPGATFTGQHDVRPTGDGSVLLLDNGLDRDRTARAERLVFEGTDVLRLAEAWDLDRDCPTQGSVRELPGGNVLATCATQGFMAEFAPGVADPVSTWQMTCGTPLSTFAEGVPLLLPIEPATR